MLGGDERIQQREEGGDKTAESLFYFIPHFISFLNEDFFNSLGLLVRTVKKEKGSHQSLK